MPLLKSSFNKVLDLGGDLLTDSIYRKFTSIKPLWVRNKGWIKQKYGKLGSWREHTVRDYSQIRKNIETRECIFRCLEVNKWNVRFHCLKGENWVRKSINLGFRNSKLSSGYLVFWTPGNSSVIINGRQHLVTEGQCKAMVLKVFSSTSLENLLEMQILLPKTGPIKSETLKLGLSNLCWHCSLWFWGRLNFENRELWVFIMETHGEGFRVPVLLYTKKLLRQIILQPGQWHPAGHELRLGMKKIKSHSSILHCSHSLLPASLRSHPRQANCPPVIIHFLLADAWNSFS